MDVRVRNFEYDGVIKKVFKWDDCTTHEMQICMQRCVRPSDLLSILFKNCHNLMILQLDLSQTKSINPIGILKTRLTNISLNAYTCMSHSYTNVVKVDYSVIDI